MSIAAVTSTKYKWLKCYAGGVMVQSGIIGISIIDDTYHNSVWSMCVQYDQK